MDLGTIVVGFVNQNGIASAVLFFLAWFVTTRVWPWLSKEYWPATVEREKMRTSIQSEISKSLIELKVIASSTAVTLQAHDVILRQISLSLVEFAKMSVLGQSPGLEHVVNGKEGKS